MLGDTKGGIAESIKVGGRWAIAGAAAGSVFPVVGTLAGAIIGLVVGSVLNFFNQVIPEGEVHDGFENFFTMIPMGISKFLDMFIIGGNEFFDIVWGAGRWVMREFSDAIGEWIDLAKDIGRGFLVFLGSLGFKEFGKWLMTFDVMKKMADKTKEIATIIEDSVMGFLNNVSSGISNFFGDTWSNMKGYFGFGGDDNNKDPRKPVKKPEDKSNRKLVGVAKDGKTKIFKDATGGFVDSAGEAVDESITTGMKAVTSVDASGASESGKAMLNSMTSMAKSSTMMDKSTKGLLEFFQKH